MSAILAQLPNELVTAVPPEVRSDKVIEVRAGQDLQALVNAATGGELFLTEPGDYGELKLPPRQLPGTMIVSKAEAQISRLPAEAHETLQVLFTTASGGGEALTAPAGSGGWRFIGCGAKAVNPAAQVYNLVALYPGSKGFAFDKFTMYGTPTGTVRRGCMLNAADVAFRGVRAVEIHEAGGDSQAICGWDGPGPYLIEDFHLEGAAENIMFGGAWATTAGLVPSNIIIRRGRLSKPNRWKIGHPEYAGIPWTIKNLLELKNGRRILLQDVVLDNVWPHAQDGYAMVLTPRGEGGHNYWATVEDITFQNVIVRNAYKGVQILGRDNNDGGPRPVDVPPDVPFSQRASRITYDNVVLPLIAWGILFNGGPADITLKRVTVALSAVPDGPPWPASLVFTNPAVPTERLTIKDSILGGGVTTDEGLAMSTYLKDSEYINSVFLTEARQDLPGAEFMTPVLAGLNLDGSLAVSSPLRARGIGADFSVPPPPSIFTLKTPIALTLRVDNGGA